MCHGCANVETGSGVVGPTWAVCRRNMAGQFASSRCEWDGIFEGEVLLYDPQAKFYKIRYTDVDTEELT